MTDQEKINQDRVALLPTPLKTKVRLINERINALGDDKRPTQWIDKVNDFRGNKARDVLNYAYDNIDLIPR